MIGDGYFVWVCPECGEQRPGPSGHRMAGDDSCSHVHGDIVRPKLMRVKVVVADEGTRSHLSRARRKDEIRWRRAAALAGEES